MSTPNFLPTIAIFIPSSAVGGAEHYIKNILPLVVRAGFQPVLVLSENQKIIDFYQKTAVECLTANISWTGDGNDLKVSSSYLHKLSVQYQETVRILDLVQPDCVFVNLPWVDFGLGISLACHDRQVPCTNLVHLCPWRVNLNDLTKQLFQELAQANSYFYTVSNDNRIQLSLSTGIDLDTIQVFYNSRDVENPYAELTSNQYKLSRLELLEELGLPLNSFLSVSVGRFSHQKNFSDILTSFAAVHDKLPHYYHLFLGEGELQAGYQRVAEDLGITHKLKFLGYRKDVNRFLALSDLFISTSIYEGLALSILEAAQFNCPIVAADSSSAREIIPSADYGLLYNPGQCYQLEKHLEFAYFHSESMKLKANNLKSRCQQIFSSTKFEADLNNVLQHSLSHSEDSAYGDLAVTFKPETKVFELSPNFNSVAQHEYRGLPESLVKAENVLEFPVEQYAQQILQQEHEKYLHCLHKLGRQLSGLKTILCFGSFNPNFFRSYYLEENYLLLIISRSQSESVTLGVHYLDHTYWGQEIEPDCLAKFTTFKTAYNPSLIAKSLEIDRERHCYTSKGLLKATLQQNNLNNLDSLSLNLKVIDRVFRPQEYFMLEDNAAGQKLRLRPINQSA
ncbi:MAG: glycosyltransferase [Cyanobacteria bacterium J06600_6]